MTTSIITKTQQILIVWIFFCFVLVKKATLALRFVGARGWIVSIECALRPLASHKKIQEKLLWRQSGIVIYHEYATLVNWDYHLILIKRHQKILLQNHIPQAVHRWIGCSPFNLYFCHWRTFLAQSHWEGDGTCRHGEFWRVGRPLWILAVLC